MKSALGSLRDRTKYKFPRKGSKKGYASTRGTMSMRQWARPTVRIPDANNLPEWMKAPPAPRRPMAKPLSTWGTDKQSDATRDTAKRLASAQSARRVNHNDRDSSTDPNGMGPTMRPLYDATASAASGLADDHDRDQLKVRVQRGAIAAGRRGRVTGDDERSGPAGPWGSGVR